MDISMNKKVLYFCVELVMMVGALTTHAMQPKVQNVEGKKPAKKIFVEGRLRRIKGFNCLVTLAQKQREKEYKESLQAVKSKG